MSQDLVHVCIIPYSKYVRFSTSDGYQGSDPIGDKTVEEVIENIKDRMRAIYPNVSIEVLDD